MTRFAFLPGSSFFHRMDPTLKLLWNFLSAGMLILNLDAVYSALWFVYVFVLALGLGGLPLTRFLRTIAPFMVFGAVLALWQVVYNPAGTQVYWQWGPLRLTLEGLLFGVATFFRILALTSLAAIFTLTTNPARLVESLMQVAQVPYRLAYTVYAGLRFLPLFENEARLLSHAHLVRGVGETGRGWRDRLRLSWSLVLPLLVSGLRRARAAAIAMDSRAFGAYPRRTVLHPARLGRLDVVFVLVHLAGAAAALYYFVVLGHGRYLIA
jgi:energy-coupling factor transport system permease protein